MAAELLEMADPQAGHVRTDRGLNWPGGLSARIPALWSRSTPLTSNHFITAPRVDGAAAGEEPRAVSTALLAALAAPATAADDPSVWRVGRLNVENSPTESQQLRLKPPGLSLLPG